jgi:cytoplasmic iron level regulating protein YaaA (DUF328/UPF0246 family)
MQIIISPAKSLDFERPANSSYHSSYRLIEESKNIALELKRFSPDQLAALMKISPKLANINYNRFQNWSHPFKIKDGKQALFAFNGEVYNGLDAYSLNNKEIDTAQTQLRILSGLYGLLRPLDLIIPYRLEMGTKLSISSANNLYEFWGNKITHLLVQDIKENNHQALINLASNEYYKSIKSKEIKVPIITPEFKDLKNGDYKVISVYAKKARGLMSRFIIKHALKNPEDLKAFDQQGYYYNNRLSTELRPVFTRDH